jgi:hypothetical protein
VPHPRADPRHPASHTRTAPVLLDFQLPPPLASGASAQLTTRTLTQTGDNPQVGAINWGTGALPPEGARPQSMNIIEHTID